MSRRSTFAVRVLVPSLLASLVACTTAPGAPSASVSVSAPVPSATTLASPSPSAPPETGSSPTRSPSSTPEPPTEPPAAILRAGGGAGVTGDVGTYTLGDVGSDAPWLHGEPAEAGSGEQVTIEVPGVTIEQWMARIGTAPDTSVRGLAEGSGPIAFDAPDAGSWSLSVRVQFPGGDVLYYWALTVR